MSRLFGRRSRIVAAAIAVAGLTVGGIVAAAPSASSVTLPPHTVQKLDHFLCYNSTSPKGFKVPTPVQLKNFLQPMGWIPTVGHVETHCNPAEKQTADASGGNLKTYKIVHPNAHLLCWAITDPNYGVQPVHLVTQFGTVNMQTTTAGATQLCLPSWKKRTGPPNEKNAAPPDLDHFACYPVVPGNFKYTLTVPAVVKVDDEFSSPKLIQVQVGVANRECIPTTKSVGGVSYPPSSKLDYSLTCFPVTDTPYWKSFFDQNQFGTGEVTPKVPAATSNVQFEELCLPTKAIIG